MRQKYRSSFFFVRGIYQTPLPASHRKEGKSNKMNKVKNNQKKAAYAFLSRGAPIKQQHYNTTQRERYRKRYIISNTIFISGPISRTNRFSPYDIQLSLYLPQYRHWINSALYYPRLFIKPHSIFFAHPHSTLSNFWIPVRRRERKKNNNNKRAREIFWLLLSQALWAAISVIDSSVVCTRRGKQAFVTNRDNYITSFDTTWYI